MHTLFVISRENQYGGLLGVGGVRCVGKFPEIVGETYKLTAFHLFTSNGRLDVSITGGSGEAANFVVSPKGDRVRYPR